MEWIELGKLGKVTTGNTPSKKKVEYYNENYIELVKPSNFIENAIVNIESGEEYLSKEGKSKGRVAEVGDILVTCIGSIGNVGIASKGVCFNQQINGIKVDKKKALSKYIAYAILYIKPALNHVANKAVVPIINKSTFEKIQIPAPTIEIQKQIVEVLDEAQKLIDNRKEQIELLDDLIKSIFYDMFGDPVKNDKGWEVKKLGELGELERGKSKHRPRNDPSLYGGKYPFIQTGDIANSGLYLADYETTYSEKGLKQSKMWGKNTLCITIAANIAKTSILNIRACFPDSVVGFISNKHSNVIYIRTWFLFFQDIIEKTAPKSAQRNINLKILNKLDVIAPPIQLQNQFAEKVQAIEKQKELFKQSLKLLEDNYNSLMQRAFKGELF